MLPSFFIAHGAPLLAIEKNEYTKFIQELGQKLPRPKAIVLFSAHWESQFQKVSQNDDYDTIYDFGGFDKSLYSIKYPANGNRKIAEVIENLFTENGVPFETESKRGLDQTSEHLSKFPLGV